MRPLPLDPASPSDRRKAVDAAAERAAHPAVLDSLVATTPAQQRSLDALSSGVCVVTGQQAGLFGGPLYTVYKAAAAIVDAQALQGETGVPCAPVFWLQDEDHDFAEIDHVALLARDGSLQTAQVPGVPNQDGHAVAHRQLGATTAPLQQLAAVLEGLPFGPALLALCESAYRPDSTPAEAFRVLVDHLFASHGLLVVDPMHPGVRDAAGPVHEHALKAAAPIAAALTARSEQLASHGHPTPVHIREGAPLSFVHPSGIDGPRVRVEPRPDGGFRVCGTERVLSAEAVERGPHTTSALLRPILQDTWLPTAMYVGGPGERAYLAQMPPLYEAFGLPMPLIVPRARFLLVDGASRRLLEQLGLQSADLPAGREALLTRLGTARGDLPEPDVLQAELTDGVLGRLERFRPAATELDVGLGRSVEKTAAHVTGAVGKLVDRYRKALARDDAVMVDRLDRLLARLQPNGAPQERVHTFAPFAARTGAAELVQQVLDSVVPFDGSLREIHL